MDFKPKNAQAMNEETEQKGIAFVQALLAEGHSFGSMKAIFLRLLAVESVEAAGKKLLAAQGAVVDTRGRVLGAVQAAAQTLKISRQRLGIYLNGSERASDVRS